MRGILAYTFSFLTFVITFAYIALRLITGPFSSADIVIFSVFIILSMVALIGMGENNKVAWMLSVLLFAFLINYLIASFLKGETIVQFLLVVLNIIAFILSIISVGDMALFGKKKKHKIEIIKEDRTERLKKELAELVKEKNELEKDFESMKSSVVIEAVPEKPEKEKGYLYFVDKEGDISRTKMARGKKVSGKQEKVIELGIKRNPGLLYYVDKNLNVKTAKMKRKAKKKAKKKRYY